MFEKHVQLLRCCKSWQCLHHANACRRLQQPLCCQGLGVNTEWLPEPPQTPELPNLPNFKSLHIHDCRE